MHILSDSCLDTALTSAIVAAVAQVDGVDINECSDDQGDVPLIVAVQDGLGASVIEALLAAPGIKVNQPKPSGFQDAMPNDFETALYIAAESASVSIVRALLKAEGIDVNSGLHYNWGGQGHATPLEGALLKWNDDDDDDDSKHRLECVAALIIAGAGIGTRPQDDDRRDAFTYSFTQKDWVQASRVKSSIISVDTDLAALLCSNIQFWTPRRHTQHGAALRKAIESMLRIHTGSANAANAHPRYYTRAKANSAPPLPLLPVELWIKIGGFLRSGDFIKRYYW